MTVAQFHISALAGNQLIETGASSRHEADNRIIATTEKERQNYANYAGLSFN
jgi:hypothetical protein